MWGFGFAARLAAEFFDKSAAARARWQAPGGRWRIEVRLPYEDREGDTNEGENP